MSTGSNSRALAAFDARFDPINLAIDHLLSIETPAQRMLRINGPAIKRACEEMDREMGRVPAAPGSHPSDQAPAGLGAPRFDPERKR
jgi:hypothetical protein